MSPKLDEIMVTEIVTIDHEATVKTAVDLMNKHAIGCLIVVESGTPVGIVTERDILKRVISKLEGSGKIRVKQIMSEPRVVGNPDMSVNKALRFLFSKQIKKLPIVEGDRLAGLVSLTDLLRSPNILKLLNETSLEQTPQGMRKVIDTYIAVERLGKKCPLIVEQGYSKRCRERECSWWVEEECVIVTLSKQLSEIRTAPPPLLSIERASTRASERKVMTSTYLDFDNSI